MSQFGACAVGEEVLMYLGLAGVPVVLPRSDLVLHSLQVSNSPVQTLPAQSADLNLGHIKPTAVFGRVMDFKAFCQPPSLLRFKHFIESGEAMRIQVVHDQAYLDSSWVSFVEHALDPRRPIFSRSMLGGCHVAFAGQRL